ncbi:MAG TPA: hypothetical protein VFM09_03095 [Marmoricola sp.]|nr:hypothetical protein [Marmoricola sp.]
MLHIACWWILGRLWAAVAPVRQRGREERGDVPGWVLITVMTAGLVAGLWAIAGPQLSSMLRAALSSVRG